MSENQFARPADVIAMTVATQQSTEKMLAEIHEACAPGMAEQILEYVAEVGIRGLAYGTVGSIYFGPVGTAIVGALGVASGAEHAWENLRNKEKACEADKLHDFILDGIQTK